MEYHCIYSTIYAIILVMDPEVKKMIEESLTLNRESNSILKGIRKAQRRAEIMKIIY
jgi:hypothetical protein